MGTLQPSQIQRLKHPYKMSTIRLEDGHPVRVVYDTQSSEWWSAALAPKSCWEPEPPGSGDKPPRLTTSTTAPQAPAVWLLQGTFRGGEVGFWWLPDVQHLAVYDVTGKIAHAKTRVEVEAAGEPDFLTAWREAIDQGLVKTDPDLEESARKAIMLDQQRDGIAEPPGFVRCPVGSVWLGWGLYENERVAYWWLRRERALTAFDARGRVITCSSRDLASLLEQEVVRAWDRAVALGLVPRQMCKLP